MPDGRERQEFAVHPGEADWDGPEARVHRAVNIGAATYEEVVVFFLLGAGADPQPQAS